MTDAENSGVTLEVAAPEADAMSDAQVDTQNEKMTKQPVESDAEINFRRLRESTEQLRQENDQYRQMMMAMQKRLMEQESTSQRLPEPEPDPFADVDPSDWATFEQAQKVAERIADQRFEQKWKEAEAKRKAEELPTRLNARFKDFDAVVTDENVKQLRALEPEIAKALSLIGDEEAKAVAAYKYIKTLVPGVAEASQTSAAKQRIEQNEQTPKSVSSVQQGSPLTQASTFEQGLTPELKKQLFAEMQQASKRA